MNSEQLYRTLIDIKLEMKMDRKIWMSKWAVATMPILFILGASLIIYCTYIGLVYKIDNTIFSLAGTIAFLIYVILFVYILEYSNPISKKSKELQLFIWSEYFLKKYSDKKYIAKKTLSLNYIEYLQVRNQIRKSLSNIKESINNTYIFFDDQLLALNEIDSLWKVINKIDVKKNNLSPVNNLTQFSDLLKSMNELYILYYSQKLFGFSNYDIDFRTSMRKEMKMMKKQVVSNVNNILENEIRELTSSDCDDDKNKETKWDDIIQFLAKKIFYIPAIISLIIIYIVRGTEYIELIGIYVTILSVLITLIALNKK